MQNLDPDDLLGKAYDPQIARRLFGFVLPYRQRSLAALALVAAVTLAELALPKIFSLAVDEVAAARRLSMLNVLGAAFVVTLIARFLASWGQYYLISWLGESGGIRPSQ